MVDDIGRVRKGQSARDASSLREFVPLTIVAQVPLQLSILHVAAAEEGIVASE